MNHRILILAALAPFAATAGAGESLQSKIDVQKLQEDLRVTDVIGTDVVRGGENAGTVEDVVISSSGRIEAVLIDGLNDGADDGGMDNNMNNDAEQQPVSVPQDKQDGTAIGKQTDEGLTKVQWSKVSYDPQQDNLRLKAGGQGSGSSQSQSAGASDTRVSSSRSSGAMGSSQSQQQQQQQQQQQSGGSQGGTFRASEIVGMEVHLADAQSFGEVEDVLIDRQQGKASALLVDAWEGFDKQTYALPVELKSVNREDNTLTYSYTESDVVALQEYEEQ